MSVREKYQPVLDLGEALGVREGGVEEQDGCLVVRGLVATGHEKHMMWDRIKECAGSDAPEDIKANITVENPDVYAFHTVSSGENLSKISAAYYGESSRYRQIFEANKDVLDSPDAVKVGQELVIPNP